MGLSLVLYLGPSGDLSGAGSLWSWGQGLVGLHKRRTQEEGVHGALTRAWRRGRGRGCGRVGPPGLAVADRLWGTFREAAGPSQALVCSLTIAGLRRGVSRPGQSRCRAQPSLCSSRR